MSVTNSCKNVSFSSMEPLVVALIATQEYTAKMTRYVGEALSDEERQYWTAQRDAGKEAIAAINKAIGS